jgi:hypothetical protein
MHFRVRVYNNELIQTNHLYVHHIFCVYIEGSDISHFYRNDYEYSLYQAKIFNKNIHNLFHRILTPLDEFLLTVSVGILNSMAPVIQFIQQCILHRYLWFPPS